MRQSAETLRNLEVPGMAVFEPGEGGLTRLAVTSPLARAHVYLQGAHLTHFQPADAEPVLFTSQKSFYLQGKPIRGGVPIIFPWFGARAGHPSAPAHGFARTLPWQVQSLSVDGDGAVFVALELTSDSVTRETWPHDFLLRLNLAIGRTLSLTLEVENTAVNAWAFENALHTYFRVGEVRQAQITGLENTRYFDKTDGLILKDQGSEPIRIERETDRIYDPTCATCMLEDPVFGRKIQVEKIGSNSTVIWNPWIEKAAALADFGDEEWPQMLCIETANVGESKVTLPPGRKHALRAQIALV